MTVNSKSKNYLIALFFVSTVAGGIFAWGQYQELSRLRADSLQKENAHADLLKRLWALEKRKNELDAEIADLRSRRDGSALAEADAAPAPGDQPDRPRPGPGGFNRRGVGSLTTLLDNPEFSRLWNAQQKMALDSRYAALFKNLNLSAADLDKFKSLLVEKQSAVMDVLAAARQQGLSPRDPADRSQIATLLQNAQAQVDSNIQQTLGATQFAQYQNYEQTLPQRNVVNQLAQSLSYSGSPLQDSQSEQLVNILAANSQARSQAAGGMAGLAGAFGGGMGGGAIGNRSTPITDAAITQAQSVLSAPQLTALQQLQAQQQAQRQIAQMMRQAASGGGAPGSGGPAAAQGGGTAAVPASTAPKPPGG